MSSGASFRGKIDRIDLMPDGGLRVTDFKTSAAASVKNALDGRPPAAAAAVRPRRRPGSRRADRRRPAPMSPPATARYLHVRDGKATLPTVGTRRRR